MNITELCEHKVLTTGFCMPCAKKKANKLYEDQKARQYAGAIPPNDMPSGLNAPYYDWPETIRCAQDLIEYLNLDFAQGNIIKSIVRENNPNGSKETTAIYEAEKQFFYSERRLRYLRSQGAGGK